MTRMWGHLLPPPVLLRAGVLSQSGNNETYFFVDRRVQPVVGLGGGGEGVVAEFLVNQLRLNPPPPPPHLPVVKVTPLPHKNTNKSGIREKALNEDTDTEFLFAIIKP